MKDIVSRKSLIMKNSFTALIPLRGGSKSIPKKNIKSIANKPLCYWAISAAIKSTLIGKVYISTDSTEIINVIKSFNYDVDVILRPTKLASDTASTEDVMLHFMNEVDFDNLVTIQATSPLLTEKDFNNGIKIFQENAYDSLLTAVRTKRFFWDNNFQPINYNPLDRPRRQDFEGLLMENGAFYITKKSILEKYECRLAGKVGIYEMHEDTAIEIDEPSDWEIVENLLKKRNKL